MPLLAWVFIEWVDVRGATGGAVKVALGSDRALGSKAVECTVVDAVWSVTDIGMTVWLSLVVIVRFVSGIGLTVKVSLVFVRLYEVKWGSGLHKACETMRVVSGVLSDEPEGKGNVRFGAVMEDEDCELWEQLWCNKSESNQISVAED